MCDAAGRPGAGRRPRPRRSGEMVRGCATPQGVTVLADLPLEIDSDEVLRFQGYKRGIDTPGPDVLALFDEALALGRRWLRRRPTGWRSSGISRSRSPRSRAAGAR